jgi:hypothetical protein
MFRENRRISLRCIDKDQTWECELGCALAPLGSDSVQEAYRDGRYF